MHIHVYHISMFKECSFILRVDYICIVADILRPLDFPVCKPLAALLGNAQIMSVFWMFLL